ncbi:28498_t:CDS:2, partial [Racocetra persica]
HWHGLSLTGNNQYDGVPRLKQCPIPNNGSFLYNFTNCNILSRPFWYHSHLEGQLVDGLKGPIVIHNPNDPYLTEYDFDYVITLSECYRGTEPNPISGDISGKGQYNCTLASNDSCNPNNGVVTYVVQMGKKYRFRTINMSGAAHYIFSIDEHPLTLI